MASRFGTPHRMAHPLVSRFLVLIMALSAAGFMPMLAAAPAAAAPAAAQGTVTVGLITKTDTNPFFVKMKEGFEKEAKALGFKTMTAAGKFDGDNASQVTAMENMITAGVKGILLVPSDTKAIVPSVTKARKAGILVITLDTPTQPEDAADALFATDNFKAGLLIGEYAKKAMGSKDAKIAMLDLNPGISVGVLRHNGFLAGFNGTVTAGTPTATQENTTANTDPKVVCTQDTQGNQAKGQTAMENCLQKDPNINLVYTINEPAAYGAYTAIKNAGKEKDIMIVTIDGGCSGVQAVQQGKFAATSQQYPLKMASEGVQAIDQFVKTGQKVSGYHDTGVTLITDKPMEGIPSKDSAYGLANCWG